MATTTIIEPKLPPQATQESLTHWLISQANMPISNEYKATLAKYMYDCMPNATRGEIETYLSKLPEWFNITFN